MPRVASLARLVLSLKPVSPAVATGILDATIESAGLGRPPPEKIMIEYDPADVDMYIRVADAIEQAFPTVIVEGNEDGEGRTGSFEISTSDGFIVYSKLDSKQFPDDEDWATLIATRASDGDKPAFYDGPACT